MTNSSSPHVHPPQQCLEGGVLIQWGLERNPAANDVGAFLDQKKVLMPLKSTISFCGCVGRKFSLVRIPIPNNITPNKPTYFW